MIDFITGREIPNEGAEANRQLVERLLVEIKGYAPQDIVVDESIRMEINGETYISSVDLVVRVHGHQYMAIKCAPGSLGSREREVLAAARLLGSYQIPLSVVSDGKSAIVWDTASGKQIGTGLEAIPSYTDAKAAFDPHQLLPLAEARRHRQQLIFRSYDSMNVHKQGRKDSHE